MTGAGRGQSDAAGAGLRAAAAEGGAAPSGAPAAGQLAALQLWRDGVERGVAEQMALDEWLLEKALQPVLRVHRWARPCASFGYFQRWEEVCREGEAAGLGPEGMIRRPTGGGLVIHGPDTALTLVVPTAAWGGDGRFHRSQAWIHQCLGAALRQSGWAVETVEQEQGTDLNCFRHPVEHDLALAGRKIVGAGQRRSRAGLLHQGTLMLGEEEMDDDGWVERFAGGLAREVVAWDGEEIGDDGLLASPWSGRVNRFASTAWRERR